MARLRVTAGQKKQLADARGAQGIARRGGVMVIPRMADPDEWEREATEAQARLIAEARDDPRFIAPEPAPVMTAPQEREYQHQYKASRHLGLTDEQRAARAYEKALER